jgi:hypothetical protein
MGVSAEILKNPLGAIERRFAIDDPFLLIELISEAGKGSLFLEMTYAAGECEFSPFEVIIEVRKELALNNADITLTGIKKPLRHDTQRSPSIPPPVTMQWTWG